MKLINLTYQVNLFYPTDPVHHHLHHRHHPQISDEATLQDFWYAWTPSLLVALAVGISLYDDDDDDSHDDDDCDVPCLAAHGSELNIIDMIRTNYPF